MADNEESNPPPRPLAEILRLLEQSNQVHLATHENLLISLRDGAQVHFIDIDELVPSNLVRLAGSVVDTAYSDWSAPVIARSLDEPETQPKADWWTETWRAYAVIAVALYMTWSVSTYAILGQDALDELRDGTSTIIAIYFAVKSWGNSHRG